MQLKELHADEGWFELIAPVASKTSFMLQSQRTVCKVAAQIEPSAPPEEIEYGFLFPMPRDLLMPWITIEVPEANGLYVRNLTNQYVAIIAQR